jgi:hypothetical protein
MIVDELKRTAVWVEFKAEYGGNSSPIRMDQSAETACQK